MFLKFRKVLFVPFLLGCLLFQTQLFAQTSYPFHLSSSFYHQESGHNVYKLWFGDWKNSKIVLENKSTGEWFRLPDNIVNIYPGMYPGVGTLENPFVPNLYYYDILSNRIVEGLQFKKSPNGKWGYWYQRFEPPVYYRMMLRNFESGEIFEVFTADRWSNPQWTDDDTLIFYRYSPQARQNEIVVFNPEKKEFNRVVLGHLIGKPVRNEIVFVKNHPHRRPWILNLTTGQERLVEDMASLKAFSDYDYDFVRPSQLPEDFDISNIEVITPTFEVEYLHSLVFSDRTVPANYVFNKDGRIYIPIRPLLAQLGITVSVKNNRIYTLSYQDKSLTLSEENSMICNERLFATPEALKILGLPDFTIEPVF